MVSPDCASLQPGYKERNEMGGIGMIRALFASLILAAAAPALAQQQKIGDPPEASNMRLVGYTDLQARSAYQPVIHKQGDRYIAYIGHHGGTPEIPKPRNP